MDATTHVWNNPIKWKGTVAFLAYQLGQPRSKDAIGEAEMLRIDAI
jgi:hypothetical protein